MKIALLNLPYDNNYGGNLQRYALMKVLQDMGHTVTHINLRFRKNLPSYKMPFVYTKRTIGRLIGKRTAPIFEEQIWNRKYKESCKFTDPFYNRYIRHTQEVYTKRDLQNIADGFDCYIVGSDQVWRKKIAKEWLPTFFLDFLENTAVKRIAYGVSLGVRENELSEKEIIKLGELYNKFDAVSVREDSALLLFHEYGWSLPQASQVLDPTLLLKASDYSQLIDNNATHSLEGAMLCYILDKTIEKERKVTELSRDTGLKPYYLGIIGSNVPSIEQWLRCFRDAQYVVTDSYHGYVFSLIFNKPVLLLYNERRGNARFESLFKITNDIDKWRLDSEQFLKNSIEQ